MAPRLDARARSAQSIKSGARKMKMILYAAVLMLAANSSAVAKSNDDGNSTNGNGNGHCGEAFMYRNGDGKCEDARNRPNPKTWQQQILEKQWKP
jgi:hypothetical protein